MRHLLCIIHDRHAFFVNPSKSTCHKNFGFIANYVGCQSRCYKSIGCAKDVNCGTYACAICGDKKVAKELVQDRKPLSKEAFDDEFFGMWLHLELVHGVHGKCLQLQY
jgi:hypothetical protein